MPQELVDNPQVIYGAVIALVIVILLTPAVGGMARLLGVVDVPEKRRLNLNPIPRLGGLALFFAIFVPSLAFLPLGGEFRGILLGAAGILVVIVAALAGLAAVRYLPALDNARDLQASLERLVARGKSAGLGLDRPTLVAMQHDLA